MTDEEQDKLDLKFIEQAKRLTMLPFRVTSLQISLTADLLKQLCSAPKTVDGKIWWPREQAIYVMDQVTIESPWITWQGSPGFKNVYAAKFNPTLATFRGSSGPIEHTCAKCRDALTLILVDGKLVDLATAESCNGALDVVWCDCPGAKSQAGVIPEWPQDVKNSIETERAGARLTRQLPGRTIAEVAALLGSRPRTSHSVSARPSRRRR